MRRIMNNQVIKECKCGKKYTHDEWKKLRLVGIWQDEVETLELRDCYNCLSTITINIEFNEYNPRLTGIEAEVARNDPNKPEGACCNNEMRGMNGGCANCGDPCL